MNMLAMQGGTRRSIATNFLRIFSMPCLRRAYVFKSLPLCAERGHKQDLIPHNVEHFAVPHAPIPLSAEVEKLKEFIASSSRLVVLTGAGCSTESGIPDYRSPRGAYSTGFKPMTHQEFMKAETSQQRYWFRSFIGWHAFAENTVPNAAHHALARLEERGYVRSLLTQNVDRLHQRAGSRDVLEMHGTTHEVLCMSCGARRCRYDYQDQLAELNPMAQEALYEEQQAAPTNQEDAREKLLIVGRSARHQQRPDGDVELSPNAEFEVEFVL
ncbi:NAD-dependent protein deacetylase srt2 [Cymbomonas tetramitiformis]|uniref:NAD-dependent protein deacetylase srt2 n=1 Tax=Cymbomonas tetramitiformis TaxID=36881 RepID=A0AAE0FBA0_9CHLO|nr:NAD-dependent protein deacetylase srt2 [Cymbomonas tetramitiformis]